MSGGSPASASARVGTELATERATELAAEPAPARWLLVSAFAIVYVVWGSTYLAIHFAIETLPPFLMSGARFLVAGSLLYLWARFVTGAPAPTRANWRSTAIVGLALLLGDNGLVVFAQFRVPSGIAALLVGVVPCCMVIIDWLRPRGSQPGIRVLLGLVLGIAGLFFLIGPDAILGGGRVDLLGVALIVVACFSWAAGSIYSRHSELPRSPFLSTAMQMLAGGVGLTVAGLLHGELATVDWTTFSARSIGAWVYLIVFGSIVAFTAYAWLLRASTPTRVSTYAYVNPVVAVVLGWALAGEPLTWRMAIAAAVILSAVALISFAKQTPANSD